MHHELLILTQNAPIMIRLMGLLPSPPPVLPWLSSLPRFPTQEGPVPLLPYTLPLSGSLLRTL